MRKDDMEKARIPHGVVIDLLSPCNTHLCLSNKFAEEIVINERVRKNAFQIFECLIESQSFKNISICVHRLLIDVRETILGQAVNQFLYRRLTNNKVMTSICDMKDP